MVNVPGNVGVTGRVKPKGSEFMYEVMKKVGENEVDDAFAGGYEMAEEEGVVGGNACEDGGGVGDGGVWVRRKGH